MPPILSNMTPLEFGHSQFAYEHVNRLLFKLPWTKTQFDFTKAYFMAIFAELAYYSIGRLETNESERVRLIPCQGFQELIAAGHRVDVREVLQRVGETDDFDFRVIEGDYSILIVYRWRQLIVVAIRGTEKLYDWLYNVRFFRRRVSPRFQFHRGFYKAMAEQLSDLSSQLANYDSVNSFLYFTGHSLGAAIAGVFCSMWNELRLKNTNLPKIFGAYTFAMPRFGSQLTMDEYPTLYHILRRGDLVPHVPPEALGFGTCRNEYSTAADVVVRKKSGALKSNLGWMSSLVRLKTIKDHSMELYRHEVGRTVGVPNTPELLPIDRSQWPGN